ncbi:MAG TPA: FtsX-like permease family protein [Acidimicrobiales bacterium]|nr:FtsX-like permease family protein [Acidimicrobiales bacterium]
MSRRARLARTLLAVALGVAFVAGTYVLTDTIDKAFGDATNSGSDAIDLIVRSRSVFDAGATNFNERDPLPDETIEVLAGVPGVNAAYGAVEGYAQIVGRDGKAIQPIGPPTLGVTWQGYEADQMTSGRPPAGPSEVVLDEATASSAGYTVGDRVRILFTGPAREFAIVGLFSSENTLGATISIFDLPTAQDVLGRPSAVDTVQVDVAPGEDVGAVRQAVKRALPGNAEVVTMQQVRDEWADSWSEALSFLTTLLLVFAAIALFVAWFIIRNTFSILVTQRTRELGLFRAIGATKRQLVASVLAEGLVVAAIASAIGLVLGLGAGIGLLAMFRAFGFDLPSTTPVVAVRTIVVGVAAGLLTTAFAVIAPAIKASRVPPVVAMAGAAEEWVGSFIRRIAAGVTSAVIGAAAIAYGLAGDPSQPMAFVGLGSLVLFVGVAAAAPALARPLAALIGRPLVRAAGEPALLARQNAVRDPRRTAATAAAVMVALSLVGVVSIVAASLKASALDAIDDEMKADLAVTPKGAMGFGAFSEDVGKRLAEVDGVDTMAALSSGMVGLDGAARMVDGIDALAVIEVLAVDEGSQAAFRNLRDGVLVHRDLAAEHGWKVGDKILLTFAKTGDQAFRVDGVFGGGLIDQNDFFVTRKTYSANFAQTLDNAVYLTFAESASFDDVRARVDAALTEFPNVEIRDQEEVKAGAAKQVDRLLAMVYALLALSLVIAFVGIGNTLALSVAERTRELGLLRAVGMTRAQVRTMVRSEAFLVALLGVGLGGVLAVGLGWAIVQALADQGMTAFEIPVVSLGIYAVVAAIAGVLAAGGPARRAAKQDILEAVATA